MGYQTRYKLKAINFDGLNDMQQTVPAHQAIVDVWVRNELEMDLDERWKWYEHEDDLKAFSHRHPAMLLQLQGEGEQAGDIWAKYFQDGKMQVCRAVIVIPPFDPTWGT